MGVRKMRFVVFGLVALCAFLALGAVARAEEKVFEPADALSPWTDESFYVASRIGDLKVWMQELMASDLLKKIAEEESTPLEEIQGVFDAVPVERFAVAGGVKQGVLHFQAALAFRSDQQPMLDRLAKGELSSEDLGWWEGLGMTFEGPEKLEEGLTFYRVPLEKGFPIKPCFAATGNLLLVGLTPDDLLASLAALADPAARFAPKRAFADENYMIFQDNGLLQLALLASEMPRLLHSNVRAEFSFGKKDGVWSLGIDSTFPQAILTAKELAVFSPLAAEPMLVGGGKTLLALCGSLNYDAIVNSIRTYGDDEAREGLDMVLQGATSVGIAEEDIRNLLTGSFSIIVGGQGQLQSAPLPGFYVVLTGQGDSAKKVAGTIVEQMKGAQLPVEEAKVEGWDVLHGTQLPATITVGAKGSSLLVGFIDPKALGTPQETTDTLKGLISRKDLFGYVFLDGGAFLDTALAFIKGEEIWGQLMGSDFDEAAEGLMEAYPFLSGIKSLRLEAPSIGKVQMILETGTPSPESDASWKQLKTDWNTKHGSGAPQEAQPTPSN